MLSYNFIMTNLKAFQDYYPEAFGHCFGCGAENPHGLHIKSYWNDDANDATIAFYTPQPYHTGGYPGYVYTATERQQQPVTAFTDERWAVCPRSAT